MSVKADVKKEANGNMSVTFVGGNSRLISRKFDQESVVYSFPKDVFDAMALAMSGTKPAGEKPKRTKKKKEEEPKAEEQAAEEITTDANEALKEL